MKTRLLLVVIFLSLSSFSFADEYVLVMSKDDNVCQHMLKIYNDDLKKYGNVRYDQHKEFGTVRWEQVKYYSLDQGFKHYKDVLMSKFDINNDGTVEIVFKDEEVTIRGINGDGLYYFKETDSEYFKDDINVDVFKRAIGRLASSVGDTYKLKELPQFLYLGIGNKDSKAYCSLSTYLYLHPFFFNGVYYLDMKEEVPGDIKGIYPSKFLVILKYARDNQINDTCYYLKVPDCKNKKQGGK